MDGGELAFARSILLHARYPDAIALIDAKFDTETRETICSFNYPRDKKFPSSGLTEMTGGQINDAIACSGYVLIGFVLDKILEDQKALKEYTIAINAHRVNFVHFDIEYLHSCRLLQELTVGIRLTNGLLDTPQTRLIKKVFSGLAGANRKSSRSRFFNTVATHLTGIPPDNNRTRFVKVTVIGTQNNKAVFRGAITACWRMRKAA